MKIRDIPEYECGNYSSLQSLTSYYYRSINDKTSITFKYLF